MKRIKGVIEDIIKFITEGVWSKTDQEYNSKAMRIFARELKVFIFTIRSYGQDQLSIRSAALTFYTLMALVPLGAIIFGIAKGFMFDTAINDYLHQSFPQYGDLITQIVDFSNALLLRTKGGVLAAIGSVVLLWAVFEVFLNIESSFNYIWDVRRSRSITRKISDYLSVVLVAPVFWLASKNANELIGTNVYDMVDGTIFVYLIDAIGFITPFLVIWVMFSVVYFVMPNTKVKYSAALKAAIIAGTAFHVFQLFYFYSQMMISKYNAIYGSFAALPLFLIWMNISWQIILFGAELSFGYQNIDKYEYERESRQINLDYRRRITVLIMYKIAHNFSLGEPMLDSDQLSKVLNIPVRVVRDMVYDLEKANLVIGIYDENKKTNKYIPSKDMSSTRIYDIVKAVENLGLSGFKMKESEDLTKITKLLGSLNDLAESSPCNVLLLDIGKDATC